MPHLTSTRDACNLLEKHGQLLRIDEEVDPHLVMPAIARQLYAQGGPAVLFEKVKGSPFPAAANLFRHLRAGTSAAARL